MNFNENTNTCQINEVELKLMQGKKSKISSLKLYLFLPEEINVNENKFLVNVHTSFLHLEILGTPHTIFQCYHQRYCSVQKTRRLLYFINKPCTET